MEIFFPKPRGLCINKLALDNTQIDTHKPYIKSSDFFGPRRCRHRVPPKRWCRTARLHGVTTKKSGLNFNRCENLKTYKR